MNLLNTEHFYDTTMNHCADYMVAMCNNQNIIALDMAKVLSLHYGIDGLIYSEVRFLCTHKKPANELQIGALQGAIRDHGLINKVKYQEVSVQRLENKGMHGLVAHLVIEPNRLLNAPDAPDSEGSKRNMEVAACRRLALR